LLHLFLNHTSLCWQGVYQRVQQKAIAHGFDRGKAAGEFFPAQQTLNDAPGKGRTRAWASASGQASRGLT
jgi:hypothetical protein